MRILALDHGERRIGVAVSDPLRSFAQPLETLERPRKGRWDPCARIAELVREYEVATVVVGLPLHLDGRPSPASEAARAFGSRVAERTGVEVEFLDERLTSVEAERRMAEAGRSARQRRGKVDPLAAALLLSTWLARSAH